MPDSSKKNFAQKPKYNLASIRAALTKKEISAKELLKEYLTRQKMVDAELGAYLEIFEDLGMAMAEAADQKLAKGETSPLLGVPIAIKDNILVKGQIASAGSRILKDYVASYDASVTSRLKELGAVFIGRTNMDEFAMGSSTESSAFGQTRNPHDLTRVPGGSSGGSAAAVAADLAPLSLGTDTGGSVREPAAFCGLAGLKGTYGAVSRFGIIALGSSLDQVGTFAHNAKDAYELFSAISFYDEHDATSVPENKRVSNSTKAKVIGVPRALLKEGVQPEVLANFEESLARLAKAGYEIREISLPYLKYALSVYYIVMPAEASANLARYDGIRYGRREEGENLLAVYEKTKGLGFGPEVRRRIILGTYVLSHGYYEAYYRKANAVRKIITADFLKAFDEVSAIALPTTPEPAFRLGEKSTDPLSLYLMDIFTVPANIAGIPALSVRSGFTKAGLPIGFQLLGAPWSEEHLTNLGALVEVS